MGRRQVSGKGVKGEWEEEKRDAGMPRGASGISEGTWGGRLSWIRSRLTL